MKTAPWDPAIFDQSFQFMGLLDLDGNVLAANQTALAFIDQPLGAVVGLPFWKTPWWIHSPEAQTCVREAVALARQGQRYRREVTNAGARGEVVVVDFSMTPIRDASGAIRWLMPEGHDITLFAAQRAALAQEEEKFRLLFQRSKDGILLLEGDRFTDCNPAVLEMMRCSEPELMRMHPWELSPPLQPDGRSSEEKALEMIHLAYDRGGHRFEWIHRRADGEDFPVEVTLIPVPLQGKQVLYTTWRDITSRKAAEASLVASEERYRRVAELTGQAVYDRNLDSNQVIWAGAIEAITGDTRDWFESRGPLSWRERIHGEDRDAMRAVLEPLEFLGGPFTLEYRFRHRDGSYRRFLDRGTVVLAPDGTRRSLGAVSDVTQIRQSEEERIDLERRILHTQKLESLGILAGGIAHDFNNLLTAILGHLNLASEEISTSHPAQAHMEGMRVAIEKAAALTRQMLAYSGRGRFQVAPLDLNALVREMRSLMAASLSKKVHMVLDLADELPSVEADAAQIQQVVLNLITNASDAIGEQEGQIQVRSRLALLDEPRLFRDLPSWGLRPGPHVMLEVEDTGCGMAPETVARIFDPFFTTKSTGRGLGLSAILGILRSHAAGLRIESEVGRGTTFQVYFPAGFAPAPEPPAPRSSRRLRGDGLVLLVDDEDAIRETARLALESIGFEVAEAADGQEALAQVASLGPRLRLVFLDLTMPRMNGREALAAMRHLRPGLPVVLCSGFSAQELPEPDPAGLVTILEKPYTIQALRERAVAATSTRPQ